MRWCAAALAMVFQCSLGAETKWLAVVSTNPSVQRAIAGARQLHAASGVVTVVASDDCMNLKPALFLTVAGIFDDQETAQRTVSAVHKPIRGSCVRACGPKPASRVHFGINAVDASIFEAPPDAVNWTDEDRLSEVRAAGSMFVWIRRRYEKGKNDPREGRRTSMYLFKTDPSSAQKLTSDCADTQVVVSDSLVALACARETAGDNLLHQVQVLDTRSGRALQTVDRCRNPKFIIGAELTCEAEAVGPDGVLKLTPKRLSLR